MVDETKTEKGQGANAVDIEIQAKIKISSFALVDLRMTLQEANKALDKIVELRPILEKTGAVAQIVAGLIGKKM